MHARRRTLSVAVVAPLVVPLSDEHPYGNQHFLCDLARGLRANGHEVVVYAAKGSSVPGVALETFETGVDVRRRFVLLRGNGGGEASAMRRAFDALFARLRGNGHDVVSQHAFDREAFEACSELPALHTLHLPPMRADLVEAVRACTGAIASVSRVAAALWDDALGRKVLALANGVPDFSPPLVSKVDAVAVIAGRISREKGTAVAIRAARAAGLRALVVGEVYDEDYFAAEVAPLLRDGMAMPAMPRARLAALLARAAVTLMPIAWDEPFGLVAAEAQLAGCPVAGFRRGALTEVVHEGVGGCLVEAGDEDGLVAAIGRARMLDRIAIRAQARRRFSMRACVERYEAVLERIAGEGAPRPGPLPARGEREQQRSPLRGEREQQRSPLRGESEHKAVMPRMS